MQNGRSTALLRTLVSPTAIDRPGDPRPNGPLRVSRRQILISAVITVAFASITFTLTERYSQSRSLLKADGVIYFLYARSLVLDFDTDLTRDFEEAKLRLGNDVVGPATRYLAISPATGKTTFPFPIGVGVLMSPFYAIGYGAEWLHSLFTSQPPDTYGAIPTTAYSLGSLVYALVGFWATWILCAQAVPPSLAYASSLAVTLAGLPVFYTFFHPTMAHAPSLAVASLFTLLWWRRWTDRTPGFGLLGLLLGVMATLRYQNVMFGVLPLCLIPRCYSIRRPARLVRDLAIGGLCFAAPVSLQLLHWLRTQGLPGGATPVSGGSGLVLEQNAMDFASPHFLDALASCQHGLFYWTPVYLLGFAGLVWAARQARWPWAFLATILAHVYLIGTLVEPYNFSGGGLYGMRYLTECSPMMALGLAVLLDSGGKKAWLASWRLVLVLLIAWNALLIAAFSLRTISQHECVTFADMARGMGELISRILASLLRHA